MALTIRVVGLRDVAKHYGETDARSGQNRIFGAKTPLVVQEYRSHLLRNGLRKVAEDNFATAAFVENLVALGSVAASFSTGSLFEMGCGIAIPSLAFSKITDRPAFAADINEEEISAARFLAGELGITRLRLVRGDSIEALPLQSVQAGDIILLSNPSRKMIAEWLAKGEELPANMVLSLYPAHLGMLGCYVEGLEFVSRLKSTGFDRHIEKAGYKEFLVAATESLPTGFVLAGIKK